MKTIELNGETYVLESEVSKQAEKLDGMEYCIVRTYSAGVFAGWVESRDGKFCIVRNARRIWYWSGACSLSQLAVDGTSEPENCKFSVPADKTVLTEAIEIIYCSKKAQESILGVPEWKK